MSSSDVWRSARFVLALSVVLGPPTAAEEPVGPYAFEAEFEEIHVARHPSAPVTRRGTIHRNAQGLTREQYRISTEPPEEEWPEIAGLFAACTGDGLWLDVTNGIVLAEVTASQRRARLEEVRSGARPMPAQPPAASPPPDWKGPVREDRGEKTIAGLICRGTRTEHHPGYVDTVWSAKELPELPIQSIRVTALETVTFQLLNVRLRDPDPALFEPLVRLGPHGRRCHPGWHQPDDVGDGVDER